MLNGYVVNAAEVNGEVVWSLMAGGGACAYSGLPAWLLKGSVATAQNAAYALTGHPAVCLRGYVFVTDTGDYQLAAGDAYSVRGYQMSAEAPTYQLFGYPGELSMSLFARSDTGFRIPRDKRSFSVSAPTTFSAVRSDRRLVMPSENRRFTVERTQ